jgi:DNA-binding transcriptional LysR family regulator
VKITHLRHFVAVAEELHFIRAADSVGILAGQARLIHPCPRGQVGADLFDRRQESTTLTGAGVVLLEQA